MHLKYMEYLCYANSSWRWAEPGWEQVVSMLQGWQVARMSHLISHQRWSFYPSRIHTVAWWGLSSHAEKGCWMKREEEVTWITSLLCCSWCLMRTNHGIWMTILRNILTKIHEISGAPMILKKATRCTVCKRLERDCCWDSPLLRPRPLPQGHLQKALWSPFRSEPASPLRLCAFCLVLTASETGSCEEVTFLKIKLSLIDFKCESIAASVSSKWRVGLILWYMKCHSQILFHVSVLLNWVPRKEACFLIVWAGVTCVQGHTHSLSPRSTFKDGPCSRFLRSRTPWQGPPSRLSSSPISAVPQRVLGLQQIDLPGCVMVHGLKGW